MEKSLPRIVSLSLRSFRRLNAGRQSRVLHRELFRILAMHRFLFICVFLASCVFPDGRVAAGSNEAAESDTSLDPAIIWRHAVDTGPLPLGCSGAPAIAEDGSIYVSAGNFLYALNRDGSERWKHGKEAGLLSLNDVAVDSDGTIYAVSNNVRAYLPNGSLRWEIPSFDRAPGVTIGDNGFLYFFGRDGFCGADSTGNIRWRPEATVYGGLCPLLGPDGTVLALGFKSYPLHGIIQGFDHDGNLKWKFEFEGLASLLGQAAVDEDGNFYFASFKGNLYALDRNGKLIWNFNTGRVGAGSPAVAADHTSYWTSSDGILYAIDPDGRLKWQFGTGGGMYNSPAVDSEGNVHFVSRDGKLYSVNSFGTLMRTVPIGHGYGSPILAGDGTIYLEDVGYFYAIRGFAPPSRKGWAMKRHDPRGTACCSSKERAESVAWGSN
ncbi:MAG: outer membrane protein assembly factor BamB family protein [Chthoniobacterales bacterium]